MKKRFLALLLALLLLCGLSLPAQAGFLSDLIAPLLFEQSVPAPEDAFLLSDSAPTPTAQSPIFIPPHRGIPAIITSHTLQRFLIVFLIV